jgi:hypothetical protein
MACNFFVGADFGTAFTIGSSNLGQINVCVISEVDELIQKNFLQNSQKLHSRVNMKECSHIGLCED